MSKYCEECGNKKSLEDDGQNGAKANVPHDMQERPGSHKANSQPASLVTIMKPNFKFENEDVMKDRIITSDERKEEIWAKTSSPPSSPSIFKLRRAKELGLKICLDEGVAPVDDKKEKGAVCDQLAAASPSSSGTKWRQDECTDETTTSSASFIDPRIALKCLDEAIEEHRAFNLWWENSKDQRVLAAAASSDPSHWFMVEESARQYGPRLKHLFDQIVEENSQREKAGAAMKEAATRERRARNNKENAAERIAAIKAASAAYAASANTGANKEKTTLSSVDLRQLSHDKNREMEILIDEVKDIKVDDNKESEQPATTPSSPETKCRQDVDEMLENESTPTVPSDHLKFA